MEKLYCFLKQEDVDDERCYSVANIDLFTKITPSINQEHFFRWEYNLDHLETGQLFYYSKEILPGQMTIKVEPVDIKQYESIIKSYRLYASSGVTTLSSNSLRNKVLVYLENYYDKVIVKEIRDLKINEILLKKIRLGDETFKEV
jgi:hypothetical protein